VWRNDIERDAFIESNCRVCFQTDEATKRVLDTGPGCPHLARAAKGKLPNAWTFRRTGAMGETYRCADFTAKPPVNRRGSAPANTVPMFDDLPEDVDFVPVEGWPSAEDFGRKKKDDKGEHQ
jgi:hypothetical protein